MDRDEHRRALVAWFAALRLNQLGKTIKDDEMKNTLMLLGATGLLTAPALATPVEIQVTVENLGPSNSIAFAPLRVGFHNGTYDSFDEGSTASDAIVSIAEGGSGADWFPAFGAADPTATLGTVPAAAGGPLMAGGTGTSIFTVDSSINQFFSFGSMVVPSNDSFIGNDSATQYQLFDNDGNLTISSITQYGNDIWDSGSEVDGAFGAAFLAGSMNSDHIDENGSVVFDFEGLDVFNGLTTAAGYEFNRQFGGDDAVYRISFAVIPAPGSAMALGLGGVLAVRRRR